MRGSGSDLLHHGCHKVVSLKLLGAELLAALWAGDRPLCSSPVPGYASFAEMVHTGQHDRLTEEITANGTCQVLLQAAFGGLSNSSSSSHDGGYCPLRGPFAFTSSLRESEEKHKGLLHHFFKSLTGRQTRLLCQLRIN